nr:glucose 1-dehydrogenase [Rhodococcus sp. (in: high G+C Gram-positive bacteria)]
MARFDGKVVIVTGAGSIAEGWGNGRATSALYAEEGARLVLVDRNEEALARTAEIVEARGAECITVTCDVSNAEGVATYVDSAVTAFGKVDILQANVGIGSIGSLLDYEQSKWELMFRVNVTSLFLAAKAVVPHMKSAGGGSIVNVSSIASMRSVGQPFAAYSSSKAAANQLVRALAVEFAPDNIRFNSVVVGFVDTPTVAVAYRNLDAETRSGLNDQRAATVPLKRQGSAWDIARASAYLASDEAQFVTGTEIVVDGGLTNTAARV